MTNFELTNPNEAVAGLTKLSGVNWPHHVFESSSFKVLGAL
jgi:hypothetical protein